MSAPSVLVLGDLVTDVIVQLREPLALGSDAAAIISSHGGGAGGNVAAWLAAAGADPTLVGRIGDDDAGRVLTAALARAGIGASLTIDDETRTGTVVVIVDLAGERSMLPDRGANLRLRSEDIPEPAIAAADHVHVSGYLLLDDGPRAAARHALAVARQHGCPVSVDPSSAEPLRQTGVERFLSWVEGVDLLAPNLDELEALTGTRDVERGARALATRCREVVVTLGARGAMWTDGQTVQHVGAGQVDVLDTTGAGDAFLAGYLVARLTGAEPAGALGRGTNLAREAVAAPGARPQPRTGGQTAGRSLGTPT